MTFVDTSALYALLDEGDANHRRTRASWEELAAAGEALITSNYVLAEAVALCQHRIGMPAVAALVLGLMAPLTLVWVDEQLHTAAMGALLAANRRDLSLVDCVSFEVMRKLHVKQALTVDPHFHEQGFDCLP